MIYISHRANLNGKNSAVGGENSPTAICYAISEGYDVEIDVWYENKIYYLGHDSPQFKVSESYLNSIKRHTWFHAKDLIALNRLCNLDYNCFYHNSDDGVLTNYGFIWTYPGKKLIADRSIAVMPESYSGVWENLESCYAICTDNINLYKNTNKQMKLF